MKKFSKITEAVVSKDDKLLRKHPSFDPEAWSKIEGLIEIMSADERYTASSLNALKTLISNMNTDSMIYWQNNVKKGGYDFEAFFRLFEIDSDEDEIKDCVRSIIDKSSSINADSNENTGEFFIKMRELRYGPDDIDELIEDVKDVHGKLNMIEGTDFKITFEMRSRDLTLPKKLYKGADPNIDAWFDLNGLMAKNSIGQIISITAHVFNPDTALENRYR